MKGIKAATTLRRTLRAAPPPRGDTVSTRKTCTRMAQRATFSSMNSALSRQAKHRDVAIAVGGALALALAFAHQAQSEPKKENEQREYSDNPIQNVTALLRLYEQIDENMSVFAMRMLENLERSVAEEKKQNQGKLTQSSKQRALDMSITFESTLEKVQDAVFRNNYVTKEQVQEAMQQLITGTLRGGGPDGKISVAEAETIDDFVRKLGRLRWKVTGSREPLVPSARSAWSQRVPEKQPNIEVTTVISVMEELIPLLTAEVEKIATALRQQNLTDAEFRRLLSQQYVKASGKMTEEICKKFKLDLRTFQAALMYYHDNSLFEETLAKMAEQQQHRFKELGL